MSELLLRSSYVHFYKEIIVSANIYLLMCITYRKSSKIYYCGRKKTDIKVNMKNKMNYCRNMTALCKKQFLRGGLGRVKVCEIKCVHPEGVWVRDLYGRTENKIIKVFS